MRLRAEVGRHAGEDHLVDPALAELQVQVVLRRAVDLVRRADDGLAVLDVFLVLRHPVGAGTFEVIKC